MKCSPLNPRFFLIAASSKLYFSTMGMVLGAVLYFFSTASAVAAIVGTGDVNPLDPTTWTSSTHGYIGQTSTGAIIVDGGSGMLSNDGYLGYGPNSIGTVMVTGTGSKWNNADLLLVGVYGSGTLNIEAGGEVSSSYGGLGHYAGSAGTVIVTGTGSKWTCSRDLRVGGFGSGTLHIEAGGEVSNSLDVFLGRESGATGAVMVTGAGSKFTCNSNLYVGPNGNGTLTVNDRGTVLVNKGLFASVTSLLGNGTISAKGGVLDADLVFDVAHGLQQTIPFGTGGNLNLIPDSMATLGAGYQGKGSLRVAQGMAITSGQGFLGYHSGSTGTATITGGGSKWTINYPLVVGLFGTGTLNIEAGAQVNSLGGILGLNANSSGAATVTGTGSNWIISDSLRVGSYGSGVLTVTDGGTVTVERALFASLNSLVGSGTISAHGAVLDADLVFDAAHGSHNTLVFGSGGTLDIDQNGRSDLGAGYQGNGTLRIAEGIAVSSSGGSLGYQPGSTGMATVAGMASKWTVHGVLEVGRYGTGTLSITGGGEVSNDFSHLGTYSGSTGTVTVIGTNSKLTCSRELSVGRSGNGILNIGDGSASGGLVTATSLILGNEINGIGVCNINGGILQAGNISCGNGTSNFNWIEGTIQNYDANTNLTVASNLVLRLGATGTHAFHIDAGCMGTVDAILSDATSGGTLTKTGLGLLTLTAANTYSGDTSVEDGTLSIRVPYLSDFVGVYIASGAKFDLNFLGSDTVGSLYLDGLPVALGTWGSSSSSATFIDDVHFSGTGTLNVVPEPSTLALLGMGVFGLIAWAWRRNHKAV